MTRKQDLRNLIMFVIAAVVISLDQYTKHLIRTNLSIGESISPIAALANILSFTHIQNQGAAFGMFPAAAPYSWWWRLWWCWHLVLLRQLARSSALLRCSWPALGGAAGNLIDRLTQQGQVTDFINFHVFAVFNMADMSIVAGRFSWPTMPWWPMKAPPNRPMCRRRAR